MRVEITESYTIALPDGLKEDVDGKVTSYWLDDHGPFLQMSSYRLMSGMQIAAIERLEQHLSKKNIETWAAIRLKVKSPDFAGVMFTDEKGWHWLFAYLVWPDLTIFATVISCDEDRPILESWATDAIESIERTR